MKKKIRNFFEYFEYLDNPLEALLFKFGFKNKCEIKIKNSNEKITIHTVKILDRLMNKLPTKQKINCHNL